jgi:low affinity Fe/Cu permease
MARGRTLALEHFAQTVTRWVGTSWAFIAALSLVVIWAITGPSLNYSENWQLVINTGTTIATFLMMFLLQRSQNHESEAIHLKLNEMIAALEGASNRLIDVEELSEEELRKLHQGYVELIERIQGVQTNRSSHSVEEATGANSGG